MMADEDTRADEYQDRWGWRTAAGPGGGLDLVLAGGLVAVLVTEQVARSALDLLARRNLDGPVLALPGHPVRWAFLADLAGTPAGTAATPAGVVVRTDRVPLPPTATRFGPVRWIRPPVPHRRLPDLLVVLAAARLSAG